MVCRLCEKKIPLSIFRGHSEGCYALAKCKRLLNSTTNSIIEICGRAPNHRRALEVKIQLEKKKVNQPRRSSADSFPSKDEKDKPAITQFSLTRINQELDRLRQKMRLVDLIRQYGDRALGLSWEDERNVSEDTKYLQDFRQLLSTAASTTLKFAESDEISKDVFDFNTNLEKKIGLQQIFKKLQFMVADLKEETIPIYNDRIAKLLQILDSEAQDREPSKQERTSEMVSITSSGLVLNKISRSETPQPTPTNFVPSNFATPLIRSPKHHAISKQDIMGRMNLGMTPGAFGGLPRSSKPIPQPVSDEKPNFLQQFARKRPADIAQAKLSPTIAKEIPHLPPNQNGNLMAQGHNPPPVLQPTILPPQVPKISLIPIGNAHESTAPSPIMNGTTTTGPSPSDASSVKKQLKRSFSGFKSLETLEDLSKVSFPGLKAGESKSTHQGDEENSLDEILEEKERPSKLEVSPSMKGYYSEVYTRSRPVPSKSLVQFTDFEFLTLIAKGAFGKVWLVRKRATGDVYAMKICELSADLQSLKNQVKALKAEKDIYGVIKGDYVVKALYTFTWDHCICFVMEYMIGGDLGFILQEYGRLDEEFARFYAAEIVLAVEHLHSLKIIHRDLKPDNILLDASGHLKLTDFGLSELAVKRKTMQGTKKGPVSPGSDGIGMQKIEKMIGNAGRKDAEKTTQLLGKDLRLRQGGHLERKASMIATREPRERKGSDSGSPQGTGMVGTPDYMAPEMILDDTHDKMVDWWSFGCILYELIVGVPPFNDDQIEKIFDNIKNRRIQWPPIGRDEDNMSPEAFDIINKLLDPNPKMRLGVKGTNEIKIHPFFQDIDWNNLRKSDAPVVPSKKSEIDTSNFKKENKVLDEQDRLLPFQRGDALPGQKRALIDKIESFEMIRDDLLYEMNQKLVADEAKNQKKEKNGGEKPVRIPSSDSIE